jgi:hypothetical protein
MDPAKQLNRAKALFTEPLAKERQCVEIVVEQVGRHRIDTATTRSRRAAPTREGSVTRWSNKAML